MICPESQIIITFERGWNWEGKGGERNKLLTRKGKCRHTVKKERSPVIPMASSAQLTFAGKKLCSLEEKKLTLVLGCTQMAEFSCETAAQP